MSRIQSTIERAMLEQMYSNSFQVSSAKENVIAPPSRKLIPLVGEREDCCKYAISNPAPKGHSYIFFGLDNHVSDCRNHNYVCKAKCVTPSSNYSHLVNEINSVFNGR